MKKGIVALLILAAIPFFVHAYVSPGKPTGFVNDFAGILLANEKAELESRLTELKTKTSSEVTVVTIPTLGDETIETYAVKLFEDWKIGQAGKDNGVLLLIALQEKKIKIEIGYGLEGTLTDAQSSIIIRNILTPAFQEGKYGEGIVTAVQKIADLLEGDPNAVPIQNYDVHESSINWFFIAIFIPMWLASILGRSKSWWAGGVLGAIAGIIVGFYTGFIPGAFAVVGLTIAGLIFDYIVSKTYASSVHRGANPPWWIGGGRGGGFGGGGFGGFGGGRSGGGGASGGW